MSLDFGERLKRYRKEKNLTQQELADKLGVSNKTVSRWESDGGYPDVPLLSPLARVLGVTVDDLLDEERPVRTLTRHDGQNLLSFAFAVGGGILFFLLRLFVPVPVCYLGYLGCMAYGVYLQRYYCYQSNWFRWGNLAMNFFVNLTVSAQLLSSGLSLLVAMVGVEKLAGLTVQFFSGGTKWSVLAGVLLALVLTAITAVLVERLGLGRNRRLRLRVRIHRLSLLGLVPALCALLLTSFWAIGVQTTPPVVYRPTQLWCYYGLLAVLLVVCVRLFAKKERRGGLVTTAVLGLAGLALPLFTCKYVWLEISGRYTADDGVIAELYPRVLGMSPALLAAGLALTLLCIIMAAVQITILREEKDAEK